MDAGGLGSRQVSVTSLDLRDANEPQAQLRSRQGSIENQGVSGAEVVDIPTGRALSKMDNGRSFLSSAFYKSDSDAPSGRSLSGWRIAGFIAATFGAVVAIGLAVAAAVLGAGALAIAGPIVVGAAILAVTLVILACARTPATTQPPAHAYEGGSYEPPQMSPPMRDSYRGATSPRLAQDPNAGYRDDMFADQPHDTEFPQGQGQQPPAVPMPYIDGQPEPPLTYQAPPPAEGEEA